MGILEMGGYLPLELQKGKTFFEDIPSEQILEVNTGRTAMWCAVNSLDAKKVLVPYYYCPDVIHMLKKTGVDIRYYHIGADLLPIDLQDEDDAAIILVNYFGVISDKLIQFSKGFPKIIFDFAHSFYTPPILEEGVMNVYSCRKFFGVSDGAYVIGKELRKPDLEQDISYTRAIHLIKSIELGTNGAYAENKLNENKIGENFLAMSSLTERILHSISYEKVAAQRNRNFRYLHQRLKEIQRLEISEMESIPYAYPLLLDYDIHDQLVENKVYVPILWSYLLDDMWNGTIEQYYAKNIIPLPLDQRYDEEQLEGMVQLIYRIAEACSDGKVSK